jgi:hypothetical protein
MAAITIAFDRRLTTGSAGSQPAASVCGALMIGHDTAAPLL